MNTDYRHNLKNVSLLRTEMAGAAFMITLGSLLHFVFDWCGGWMPIALIAAVNESIWEHLKLVFWPGVLWAAIMPVGADLARRDVFAAKGISLLVSAVLIVLIFSAYTAILGGNLLVLDIGTFVFSILMGQLFSAWLVARDDGWRRGLFLPGLVLFGLQLAAYSLLTYFPPDHWLFVEAHSGLTGIVAR